MQKDLYQDCLFTLCIYVKMQLPLANISLLDFYKSQYRIGLKNPLLITL